MDRPYIFCHMLTSLDGKIMGPYMDSPEGKVAEKVFYQLVFSRDARYKHQGWISGRITTDDNFTFYKKPKLNPDAPVVPEGDFIANSSKGMYYVSIDPSGKLGWESSELTYGDTTAHVIEILTEKASHAYRDFLRKLGISYLIAGKEMLDYEQVLKKLKNNFGIETLMLGGGGVLNWSFIQAGMCDEISLVVAPSADGSTKTPTLFSAKQGLSTVNAYGFELKDVQVMDGGCIWLSYFIKNNSLA